MNIIKKQKNFLIGIGIFAMVASILLLVFGILLLVRGIVNTTIAKLIIGPIMILLSAPIFVFGFKAIFVASALKAVDGSLKQDNLAKAGTINMKKCDKCGTEILDGETVCSNCGKSFEE